MKFTGLIFQRHTSSRCARQHGISLVVVMIFLLILSVLGIAAIQSSTLGARVARNEADRTLAFQAAEAALRDGELDVKNLRLNNSACVAGATGCRAQTINRGDGFDTVCSLGLCDSRTFTSPVWEDTTKWATSGPSVMYGAYTAAVALPVVGQQPRYILEYFPLGESVVYRITAVGFGANTTTQVMLQSTVKAAPV